MDTNQALVLATLTLALVTLMLWWQAREALKVARKAETARQREVQIAAVRPLLLREPAITMKDDGPYFEARVNMPEVGSPVLGLSLNLRRDGLPDYAWIRDVGSKAPGDRPFVEWVHLAPFCKRATYADEPVWRVSGDPHELIAQHYGLLGQRIVEHYEWWLGPTVNKAEKSPVGQLRWRLSRMEIIPNVAGAEGLDLPFGPKLPSGPA